MCGEGMVTFQLADLIFRNITENTNSLSMDVLNLWFEVRNFWDSTKPHRYEILATAPDVDVTFTWKPYLNYTHIL